MKLTKTAVERLALPSGKNELLAFDDGLPGFGLRIRAGGKRTWIVQYRIGQKQRRVTLGNVETIGAEEARRRAKNALSKVHLGTDPQLEKAEDRAQAAMTFGSVVESYLARHASRRLKPSTLTDVERYLRKHWAPLSKLPVRKLTRADVAAGLARIAEENGGLAANRARAALSSLYSWSIAEGLTDANPAVGTRRAVAEVSRDRVLSDEELKLIWTYAGDGSYAAIIHLLVLTGQRREEVGGMRWSELDLETGTWRISAERTKNGLAHDVPLSSTAISILRALGRRKERDLVFGSREGPFSGWSHAKKALDARMKSALDRAAPSPWRLHDIRRTVATRLADLGMLPHVVEAVLNHISGHKSGVAGVYNRAAYAKEKRHALAIWADYVLAAAHAAPRTVVPLRAGGRP